MFFDVKWGILTNGQQMMAFVRTDTFDIKTRSSSNQLTFSDIQDINTQNDIHFGFMGLCYASLDERPEMQPEGVGTVDIIALLCPVGSRVNPLPPTQ